MDDGQFLQTVDVRFDAVAMAQDKHEKVASVDICRATGVYRLALGYITMYRLMVGADQPAQNGSAFGLEVEDCRGKMNLGHSSASSLSCGQWSSSFRDTDRGICPGNHDFAAWQAYTSKIEGQEYASTRKPTVFGWLFAFLPSQNLDYEQVPSIRNMRQVFGQICHSRVTLRRSAIGQKRTSVDVAESRRSTISVVVPKA